MSSHQRCLLTPQAGMQQIMDFLAGLQEIITVEDFGAHLVRLIGDLVPGVVVGFDEIEEDGTYKLSHNAALTASEQQYYFGQLTQFYQQNPIHSYIHTPGAHPVVRISDLVTRRAFQKTDLYQSFFRHVEIEAQMHVILPVQTGSASLSINHRHNFDDEMVKLFRMLTPHIALAHTNAKRFSQMEQALQQAQMQIPPISCGLLTLREEEILYWIREGKRNSEIAVILDISARTVEKHTQNIFTKLQVETRSAAARWRPTARRVSQSIHATGISVLNGHHG